MTLTAASSISNQIKRIVVIGASIGGIDALIRLVSGFTRDQSMAVLVVQHLRKTDEPPQLPIILNRHTTMDVVLASDGQLLSGGKIYVAEPGQHLCISGDRLSFMDGKPVNHVKPAADVLFTSTAETYGDRTIGVVLTGTGKDGTEGCRRIKSAGGVTIAQDQETSTFFDMPASAINSGVIDYVLPLSSIAAKIKYLMDEPGFINRSQENRCLEQ